MENKVSSTIEDYLGVIYVLERDSEPIHGVRLAEMMGVSAPTVTNTLKRMVRDGLLEMDPKKGTHLTPTGLEQAKTVMRRHMLAEWMLSKMLSWSKLHKEAHSMEHAISQEVEATLIDDLNQPELCPHGNPLPGHEAVVQDWIPLTNLSEGDQVVIRRIHELAEETHDVLSYLEEHHIEPGAEVQVVEILPFNETITLQIGKNRVTLGNTLAKYIFGEKLPVGQKSKE
jgi:DtxR family Mn-dependent transcriptional regulator